MKPEFALIIFDADDTLRHCVIEGQEVPTNSDEWELLPFVERKLSSIKWGSPHHGGVGIGVASNQSWIAKGLIDCTVAKQLLTDMIQKATGYTPPPWVIQICPHLAEDDCKCRKPKPAMLRNIMDRWGVGPNETLFVGNSKTDADAAWLAGCWFSWAEDFLYPPFYPFYKPSQIVSRTET